jgi:hypothetical protein
MGHWRGSALDAIIWRLAWRLAARRGVGRLDGTNLQVLHCCAPSKCRCPMTDPPACRLTACAAQPEAAVVS